MDMVLHAAIRIALLIAALRCTSGAIPEPCVNAGRTAIMEECCPEPSDGAGQCGSQLSPPRGQCVPVSDINSRCVRNESQSDPRKNWPHFFTSLCKCEGNYYGYDCGECKFGYQGETCSEPVMRKRKSLSSLDNSERLTYLANLRQAKHDASYSRYLAIRSEEPLELVQVPLYDLFTWLHYYAGRENNELGNPNITVFDFAHESGGFPTWHRLFLLWFEREMQILTGNDDFTIPYWEWTVENDREVPLTDEWLGGIDTSEEGAVSGYFGSTETWLLVCLDANETVLCDPSSRTGKLSRCPSTTECMKGDVGWPSQDELDTALSKEEYDAEPYSRFTKTGFRNYMEGFETNGCTDGVDILCSGGIRRRLHNVVHIILGIGDFANIPHLTNPGTMGDVPIATNDPIFINHHSMIDYIFEQWLLLEYDTPFGPPDTEQFKYIGHREHDCLVPFIPLFTNFDFYKNASAFGYEYEENVDKFDRSRAAADGPTAGALAAAVLACSIAGLV